MKKSVKGGGDIREGNRRKIEESGGFLAGTGGS